MNMEKELRENEGEREYVGRLYKIRLVSGWVRPISPPGPERKLWNVVISNEPYMSIREYPRDNKANPGGWLDALRDYESAVDKAQRIEDEESEYERWL